MSVPSETLTPLANLYREVAAGEFQARASKIGPVAVHPDYLAYTGQRGSIDEVGVARDTIGFVMDQFASNDDRPLSLKEILADPAPEYRSVAQKNPDISLNVLVRAQLLGTERQGDTQKIFPLDAAYELDHTTPFRRTTSDTLVPLSTMAGVTTGVLVLGSHIDNPLELAAAVDVAQVTGLATYGLAGLASAVQARRFYKKYGF